jgi:hypothetical protein
MCFINVLFKVITNLNFYKHRFIKDNLHKHFCSLGWCFVRQRNRDFLQIISVTSISRRPNTDQADQELHENNIAIYCKNSALVADEPSQHLISSFKYLDPHFHSQTTCPSIVNMNMHRNNGEPLELRIIFILLVRYGRIFCLDPW